MLGHGAEISVVVQQLVAPIYAKGGNDYVGQASGGNADRPQTTIVGSRLYCQLAIQHLRLRKALQIIPKRPGVTIVASPAKYLKKNHIAEEDIAFGSFFSKSSRTWSVHIPNGGYPY
jgi:hypothetical protein